MKKYILLILISLIGSGCAGIVSKNIADNRNLKVNEGIFVSNIISNVDGSQISIINNENNLVASGLFNLKAGDNLIVVALPEGDYSWASITFDRGISDFRGKMPFKVEKSKVNYVGDIEIDFASGGGSYHIRVISREDKVKQKLKEKFPNIANKHDFTVNMTKMHK